MFLASSDGWVSRQKLADLFRPDPDDGPASAHYVRNLVSRALKLEQATGLEIERTRCRWDVDTDVRRFRRAVLAGRWLDAMQLYTGRYLDDLTVEGAPLLQEWIDTTRAELHTLWQNATMQYAAEQEGSGNHARAAMSLARLLEQDRLYEEAVQAFLRNSYLAGHRDEAMALGERFRRELDLEMGLEPLPATEALLDQIRSGNDIAPVRRPRSLRNRWTDRAGLGSHEYDRLLTLLKTPGNRLEGLLEAADATGYKVVVSRGAVPKPLALAALTELAEALFAEGHRARAAELVGLIMFAPAFEDDPILRRRVAELGSKLANYLPRRLATTVLAETSRRR